MIPQPVETVAPEQTRVLVVVIPQPVETLRRPRTDPSLGGGDPAASGNFGAGPGTDPSLGGGDPAASGNFGAGPEQTLRLEVEIRLVILVAITMVVAYPMLILPRSKKDFPVTAMKP